ncbi:MAG: cob(I)yrinic acid a,c-diamide adenosyltransferase [Pseudomonadota bacterium]
MSNRLSKITTRTGDDGTTGLGDGSRVTKYNLRVETIGEIDELNSAIGVVLVEPLSDDVRKMLIAIQHDLFDLGGEICIPGRMALEENHLARLDTWIAKLTDALPPLKEFILPGGNRAAAFAHVARTVCRRAERRLVELAQSEEINQLSQKYLNRLSDLLFQLSRIINRDAGVADTYWQSSRHSNNVS